MASAIDQHETAMGTHAAPPSWTPLLCSSPALQVVTEYLPALGSLQHASNSHWLSVLHMITYMFQYYSPKSSHSLLPPSPKDCSIQMCLFCCLRLLLCWMLLWNRHGNENLLSLLPGISLIKGSQLHSAWQEAAHFVSFWEKRANEVSVWSIW